MQNGYIESFTGESRNECLNKHCFERLPQARSTITARLQDYNEVRPRSSRGSIPLAEFAQRHRGKNSPQPASGKEINSLQPGLPPRWYGARVQVIF